MELDQNALSLRHNLTDMMSKLNHISGFVLLVLWLQALPGKGMDIDTCRGVNLDTIEDHTMHMNECLKKAGVKEISELPASEMACFGKCVFKIKGMIDDKGMPHKENIMKLITDNLPKEVHDDLDKRMETCLLPNTTSIIDNEDETCTTYLPMLMCVHIAFLEECEGV